MTGKIPFKEFSAGDRTPIEVIMRQANDFKRNTALHGVLENILNAILILNKNRQIVYMNSRAAKLMNVEDYEVLLGLRPGEAIQCTHAKDSEYGCGTTVFCKECGANKAIQDGFNRTPSVQECRITRIVDGEIQALELLVISSEYIYNNEQFYIVSLADISHEKRRRALERIFFHDVLNTASGLSGAIEMLKMSASAEIMEPVQLAEMALNELIDQIQSQRQLIQAENNELTVSISLTNTIAELTRLVNIYTRHPVCIDKHLKLSSESESIDFYTDRVILGRVLGNLIKNALEASTRGETVTVKSEKKGDAYVCFKVHNPAVMPENVQLQIFNRSFTTKGVGRGLGTYSVKLLTTRYLKGSVSFISNKESGTTFEISLPLNLQSISDPKPTDS